MNLVRLSRQAEHDLDSIVDYLSGFSRQAAVSELRKLRTRFGLIARHPALGELRDELSRGLRIFSAGRFVILYIAIEGGIEVVGVVHGARDLADYFRRPARSEPT
jgi:toxin ParE1/3/4